jgi:hypothetical protein
MQTCINTPFLYIYNYILHVLIANDHFQVVHIELSKISILQVEILLKYV